MSGPVDEHYFPRGKATLRENDKEVKQTSKRKPTSDLFKVMNATKKQKTKKVRKERDEEDSDQMADILVEPLTHKTIQSGMVILGAVHNVHEEMLRISLPGCIAQLPMANLSTSYNNLMRKWSQIPKNNRRMMNENLPEKLVSLDEIFEVGQLLKVTVRQTTGGAPIVLSAIPEEVNGSYHRDQLKDGMVLQAAVSSAEDHGYGIELGIRGLETAFIRADAVGSELYVGQMLLVRASMLNKNGRIKFVPHKFEQVIQEGEWNLNTIMPGMVVQSTIIQNDERGVGLWLLTDSLLGAVEPRQIPKDVEIQLEETMPAIVLYKHPILNVVYCSLRVPLFDEKKPFEAFHGMKSGQLIPKAVVMQVASTYVKLEIPVKKQKSTVVAIATRENICDDETVDPSDVFSAGQVTQCRVLGLSLMEGEIYVSLKQSVISNDAYFSEDDLVVGKVLMAKVKYTNDTGIVFDICPGVVAFCDFVEASTVMNKNNAAHLYPKGKPCQVRIRYINGKHHPKRYFVTVNKQLVKSKSDIIDSYSIENMGKVSEGIVLMVKPRGCLLGFYNKVRGWVPEEYLSENWFEASDVLKVGQVVTARVMSVTPEATRMTLSLRSVSTPGGNGVMVPPLESLRNVVFRTNMEGEVMEKQLDSVKVEVEDLGVCRLQFSQLSDFSDLSKVLMSCLKPGDKLKGLTHLGKDWKTEETLVTCKPYVRSMVTSGQLKKPAAGSIIPVTIKRVSPGGAAVLLPNNLPANIGLRELSDAFVPKNSPGVNEGATLICKVKSIVDDSIEITSKQSEVQFAFDSAYKNSLATSLRFLLSFKLEDCIGQVVKVIPTSVNSNIICDYKGRKAIASPMLTTRGQKVAGVSTNAVILGYGFSKTGSKEYIVSLDRDVVYKYLQMQRRNNKSLTKVAVKTKVEAMVLAVTRDYAATMTKDGRLLFITLGSHFNDFRRGKWTLDEKGYRLPRFVQVYIQEMIGPAMAVGNFCGAEGVTSKVEVHEIKRIDSEDPSSKSDVFKILAETVEDADSNEDTIDPEESDDPDFDATPEEAEGDSSDIGSFDSCESANHADFESDPGRED